MERIRFFFSKKEEASYISHLDLQRVMARALRQSKIPVWYSQGFNPHIYMTFSLPLPLMQHSDAETMDCKTEAQDVDFTSYIPLLNKVLPKGIVVSRIAAPVHKADEIAWAEYCIRYQGRQAELALAVQQYNQLAQAMVVRKTKRTQQEVDLKQVLPSLEVLPQQPEAILVCLPAGGITNYNPEMVTRFLEEAGGLPAAAANVLRTGVFTQSKEVFC